MRYRDITADVDDRFRLPASHPILAEVDIEPADWFQFEKARDGDNLCRPASSAMTFSTAG